MPLQGLPSILEVSMEQMLDTYNITSWSIRSGNKFSEVSIRFNMTADVHTETKYRKVPPSRLTRDRERAASRIVSSGHNTSIPLDLQDQGSNVLDNQDKEVLPVNTTVLQDYCMTPIHNADILILPVGSPSPVSQVDGTMDSKADCIGSLPLRSGQEASLSQETRGGNDIDACQCSKESVGPKDKCDVEKHATTSVKVTQSREFICSKCKVKLPQPPTDIWQKCTHPECNIDVCKACWNTGSHSHHLRCDVS